MYDTVIRLTVKQLWEQFADVDMMAELGITDAEMQDRYGRNVAEWHREHQKTATSTNRGFWSRIFDNRVAKTIVDDPRELMSFVEDGFTVKLTIK